MLAAALCFLYAYFFQGGGWNQNSHFDTVRSIVERHAFDITPDCQRVLVNRMVISPDAPTLSAAVSLKR